MESQEKQNLVKTFGAPLIGGMVAGVTVCTTLYPLDTLKTRLQSQHGFYKSGGFKGVYRGIGLITSSYGNSCFGPSLSTFYVDSMPVGSMPVCAIFFVSYETTKTLAMPLVSSQYSSLVYMFAASISEVLCCAVKVPVEIAKQRKQAHMGLENKSSIRILAEAYKSEGLRKGLYRGFLSTVLRDLPYSFIELPIWEGLKTMVKERNDGNINGIQSATCGAIASAVAGAVTTPLDLAKTRVMLAEGTLPSRNLRIGPVLTDIYLASGFRGLFAGLTPRIAGIMLGGFVFFGVYEDSKAFFERYCDG